MIQTLTLRWTTASQRKIAGEKIGSELAIIRKLWKDLHENFQQTPAPISFLMKGFAWETMPLCLAFEDCTIVSQNTCRLLTNQYQRKTLLKQKISSLPTAPLSVLLFSPDPSTFCYPIFSPSPNYQARRKTTLNYYFLLSSWIYTFLSQTPYRARAKSLLQEKYNYR